MSSVAVVHLPDNIVINKIVAEVTDVPPRDCVLVEIGPLECDIGWLWDGTGFVNPNPPDEVP